MIITVGNSFSLFLGGEGSIGDWIQGLMLARKALYHLCHTQVHIEILHEVLSEIFHTKYLAPGP
jgi:hypothetical protein